MGIMLARDEILGVILAGGGARRMFAECGGSIGDKGLLDLAGKPMLAQVIERLAPQVGAIVLNANGDPDRLQAFGLEVIPDLDDSRSGPLAGFAAAMAWAAQHRPHTQVIVTVPADVPFIPTDLVETFLKVAGGSVAIAVSDGQRHPAVGLWPLSLRCTLEAALADGQRRVEKFAQRHAAIAVSFPFSNIGGRTVDPFFNANTPDDMTAARTLLTS